MKQLPNIAGALLGFLFVAFGLIYFLKLMDMQPPPEGSPMALFMGAMAPTGYLDFVKVLEILGGILVAIPLTRNFGLLVLGPIIVNIMAFHVFFNKGAGLLDPVLIVIMALAAFLLWSARGKFLGLLNCKHQAS